MSRLAALFILIGLAAATGIILWSGYASVLEALRAAGWGILWTSLFHIIPLCAAAVGWRMLMPGRGRPSPAYFLYLLWLRGAVNNLMPVARIGGEIVSVRVMMKRGIRKSTAIAATVVELTLSVAAVFFFILCGVFLLSLRAAEADIGWKLAGGLIASTPMLAALAIVQHIGFFGLCDKIFTLMLRERWKKFAGNASLLDRAIRAIYRRKTRALVAFLWLLLSWCLGSGEVWLGLDFLGHRLVFIDCFIIEALIQGASSAGFAIPGALGVQEAGFVFFGHLFGLSPDIAAALAVIRRCRDLILYLPGLIWWQAQESRWLLHRAG